MLTRIFSALLATAILIIVLILPDVLFDVTLSFLAILAMWELYAAFKNERYKPVEWLGYLSIIIIFALRYIPIKFDIIMFQFIIFSFLIIMCTVIVLTKNKVSFVDVSITIFSIFYITISFNYLIMTKHLDNGNYLVWFIFLGGWVTDIFAYFIGKFYGRKKLIHDISPNKTVEGALGGMIGCIIAIVIYGLFFNYYKHINLTLIHYLLLGTLCSIFAQFGDLMASSIKRKTNIKDFGYIIPGHGGIIDRFDSILLVSPLVYFFFYYFI